MKTIKVIIGVSLFFTALLFGIAAFLPNHTHVERTIEIDAPEALVFDLVSNHQNFQKWSPWAKLDPNMEVSFSGPAVGVGSTMGWVSENSQVGTGSSIYTQYSPDKFAELELNFGESGGMASFQLDTVNGWTKVVWDFDIEFNSLLERYYGLLLDGMLGSMYERGLNDLKALAQSLPTIETEEISYDVDGVTLTGYLAKPTGAKNAPGVLVIHEWWGHNDYARERAEMLAELGYAAFALDMYGDGKVATHPADAQKFMMQVIGTPEVIGARFDKAREILSADASTHPDNIAAIGYCFGGAVSMSMARSGKPLKGVVSFHGALQGLAPIQDNVTTPMLVLNGEADPFITAEQIQTFKQDMDGSTMPYKFVNYPGAKHAFTNPAATEKGEAFNIPLAYDKNADEQSWAAMQTFLKDIFNQ